MKSVYANELNIDGLKKRIDDERKKYDRCLQDIPRSTDDPDYKWHLNRADAQQHKLIGLEMALMILIGKQAA
jgi:hypothetical protein